MAWPPAALPTNRTNATPQTNTHAADHNAIALAINDTVGYVQVLDAGATRYGTIAHQSGQSIAAGQVVDITWSSVTDGAYGTGQILTVPAGRAGVYTVSIRVAGPAIPAPPIGVSGVFMLIGGIEYACFIPNGQSQIASCVSIPLPVGTQVFARVYNSTASAAFYTVTLHLTRVCV